MKNALVIVPLAGLLASGCQGQPAAAVASPAPASPSPNALATEDDKTLYALGVILGGRVTQLKLSQADLDKVSLGFRDSAAGKTPQVEMQQYGPMVEPMARARAGAGAQAEKDKAKVYLDKAAAEPGAAVSPSGLVHKVLQPGTGKSPKASDTVSVHYVGRLADANGPVEPPFDSSVARGEPTEFPLSNVVPCWTEGLQKMKVGEKAQLVCPSSIAYGDAGRPPKIPGGATLVFEVELLAIK